MKDIMLNKWLTDLPGELEAGECGLQTMELIARTEAGEWKTSPLDGLGASRYGGASEPGLAELRNKAAEAMARNRIAGKARVENGQIKIEIY